MKNKQKEQILSASRQDNKLSFWFLAKFLLILILVAPATNCFASDGVAGEYFVNPRKKIEAVIAAGELNRIAIFRGEITEIIGDESKYSIHWSSDYRNLFIYPKVDVGENIELSLIMSGGIAQDIRFTVGDCTSRTIFLSNLGRDDFIGAASTTSHKYSEIPSLQLKSEIDNMMRSMLLEVKGKYYVLDIKRTLSKNKDLYISQEKAYRYKNLSGAVLSVQNRIKENLAIKESDILGYFNNVVAINIGQRLLPAKAKMQILVITQEADSDV